MIDFAKLDAETLISTVTKKRPNEKAIELYKKQMNPETHEIITNKTKYRDKIIEGEDENGNKTTDLQPINRIAIGLQKLIVDKAVAFGFAKPVTLTADDTETLKLLTDIFKKNKLNTVTRNVARNLYSYAKTAELWYFVPDQKKIRVLILDPNKETFYPIFDNGDMIAFVREVLIKEPEQKITEIYTDHVTYKVTEVKGVKDLKTEPNPCGKIPIIYADQEKPDYYDVQPLIERIEELISGHAEINDYHVAPKLKATGEIVGFAKKGEKSAIFEMEQGANLDYLTWNQNIESFKLELSNLMQYALMLTQTPDISFEAMKGLGQLSGIAAKYFFMDAHLKVEMRREVWDEYFERRISVVKALYSTFISAGSKEKLDNLDVSITLNPYIIDDVAGKVDHLGSAVVSKIMSRKTAVATLNATEDVDAELKQIEIESELSLNNQF